jgi:hypothetical protein
MIPTILAIVAVATGLGLVITESLKKSVTGKSDN